MSRLAPAAGPLQPSDEPAMSARAIFLGLLWVVGICVGSPYSLWLVGSTEPTWSHFPSSVGCPFVVLVLGNALLRRFGISWALRPAELITMLVMGLVVTGIPIFVMGTLMALISAPYYAATPENQWRVLIQPYLPRFAVPQPEGDAIRWFWEGLPSGQSLPYHLWLGPIFWWFTLLFTVYFVCFCIVVILRRQWQEEERLVYPITELPRLLLEDDRAGRGTVLRSPVFWTGFSIALGMVLFSTIRFFQPGFADLAVWEGNPFSLGHGFPVLDFRLVPPILGFMFFANTSISFSIWFFYLVAVLQEGITNRIGYDVTQPDAFVWGMQSLSWQGWGAFCAMLAWSMWMGRGHLRSVFGQAFGGHRRFDDRSEMLGCRTAVLGLIVGLAYCIGWLCAAGLDLHVALLFTAGVLIAYTGMTRLVVQTGMYYLTTPVNGQAFAAAVSGTAMGAGNLVPLGLQYAWHGDVQSIFMPSAAHASRLERITRSRGWMSAAIAAAVVVGFASTFWYILYVCHEYGAGNLRSWYFGAGGGIGRMAFSGVIRQIDNPAGTDWGKLFYSGVGAFAYSAIALCQYRFHWWPLHPVGIALAPMWMTRLVAFSVFVAWLTKTILLAFGGIQAYQQARPFFVGLVAGFFLGVGVSFLVDATWFFGYGHGVPW